MAALLHINRPPAALIPEYQRVNVEGTARLLERAQRARVDRLVFTSSVCVYGGNRGTPLSEHTLPKPDSLYASTKLEAEQLVLGATRADGQPLGTVIRLAAVYGPRLRGNYVRLLKALSRHRFVAIGAGSNHRALVFDRDVGRAIALAAAHPSAAGKVFNLSDGQVHTFAEIVSAMCDALGTPAPRLQIPVACARAAAFGVETVARLLGRPAPIDVRTIDKLVEDVIIDSAQIERELAFQPRVTLRAGWDIVVKALRQQGELN
jgi:UDP-glucose 4-epimerase